MIYIYRYMVIGWRPSTGGVMILGEVVRSAAIPWAVRSGVILLPKTTPLHAHACLTIIKVQLK